MPDNITNVALTFDKLPQEIKDIIFDLTLAANGFSALFTYGPSIRPRQQLTSSQASANASNDSDLLRLSVRLCRAHPLILVNRKIHSWTLAKCLRAVTITFASISDIVHFTRRYASLSPHENIRNIVLDTSVIPKDDQCIYNREIAALIQEASARFRHLETLVVNFDDLAFNPYLPIISREVDQTDWPKLKAYTVEHASNERRVRRRDQRHLEMQRLHNLRPRHPAIATGRCQCTRPRLPYVQEAATINLLRRMNIELARFIREKNAGMGRLKGMWWPSDEYDEIFGPTP